MFDSVIRGGTVVASQGAGQYDVAISGETIAAVTAPGAIAHDQARRVIDAAGDIFVLKSVSIMAGATPFTRIPRGLSADVARVSIAPLVAAS